MSTTVSVDGASGLKKAGVRGTAVLLVIAWLVPFVVHSLPWKGASPLGAHLLPMFWATFIAAYLYGANLALIVGLFAPLLNFIATGLPAWRFLSVLSFELAVFAVVAAWASRRSPHLLLVAPLAYLAAKVGSTVVQAVFPIFGDIGVPLAFFADSVVTALPGLGVLAVINYGLWHLSQEPQDWDQR